MVASTSPDAAAGRAYRRCSRCIMDASDREIRFDSAGVCNHCANYDAVARRQLFTGEEGVRRVEAAVREMKAAGRSKPYDCIIGVSGGVDSTYVAHLTRQLGLRALAVHMDNGWNSELAVRNIERVVKLLGIDLHTEVLDWEEFRDLQLAFLKASVPDGEIPTDHAIVATLYRVAAQHGVPYLLSGTNAATEGVMPSSWTYGIGDWRYISAVHRRFGARSLDTFPHVSTRRLAYYSTVKKIRSIRILNLVPYERTSVMRVLQEDLGWKYYGGKHYESIYTRFFQGYILPRKFGIDKRIAHLSALICSGQVTREEALLEMEKQEYTEQMQRSDREYALKKLELTEAGFDAIMALPVKSFADYPNSQALMATARSLVERTGMDSLLKRAVRLGGM